MATFFGTEKDFNDFIGPRIRNVVNLIAKQERENCNKICQMCKTTDVELQSAHIHGRERKTIVSEVLQKYKNGDNYLIDIQQVENEIKEAHYPIKETFLFLCHSCHKRYDSIEKNKGNVQNISPFLQTTSIQDRQSQDLSMEKSEIQQQSKTEIGNSIFNKNSHPEKEYFVNAKEVDKSTFEKKLRNTICQVKVTLYYNDKNPREEIWRVKNFNENSSLDSNINSGYLRGWSEKGIKKIKLEL